MVAFDLLTGLPIRTVHRTVRISGPTNVLLAGKSLAHHDGLQPHFWLLLLHIL